MHVGASVPNVPITVVTEQIEYGKLADFFHANGLALCFFPAAFTGTCRTELCRLRDEAEPAADRILGISVDLPFALQVFRERNNLPFALVSDADRTLTETFELAIDFADIGLERIAQRAVFILDDTGTVTYRWVAESPGDEPPYAAVYNHLNLP